MEIMHSFINYIMHIDQHLLVFVTHYGAWVYALMFLIIFCETGLVITPILPGDSMLFAAGSIAASTANDKFNIQLLFVLLVMASILGNSLNYLIGRFFGPKIFSSSSNRFFNKHYLQRAHAFYERFGGKTIIIARFIPIIRTFAPFVAGIAQMTYQRFSVFNVLGAFLWIGGLLYSGYFFSQIPGVKEHFSLVVLGIIIVSMVPVGIELLRQVFGRRKTTAL
jgi:membrane-associated protein